MRLLKIPDSGDPPPPWPPGVGVKRRGEPQAPKKKRQKRPSFNSQPRTKTESSPSHRSSFPFNNLGSARCALPSPTRPCLAVREVFMDEEDMFDG